MLFGGLVIQVLIQAAILQLSLKLIAKHEADTSFTKAAMVTAGITVGNFLVILLLRTVFPLLIWPAQIALTAAVIMTFCWISFWKSVVVVLVFVVFQVIFAVVLAVAFGFSMAAMFASGAMEGGGINLDYKNPSDERTAAMQQEALLIQQEALRMQQQAQERQARIEAEARKAEMGEIPTNRPPQKQIPPAPSRMESKRNRPYARRTARQTVDWEAAQNSLRMGGVVAVPDGHMAMIDGKMVQAGETVKAEYNGHQYRWKVKSVSKTAPSLEQMDVQQLK